MYRVYIYIYIHTRVCTHTYIHTYKYIYIYITIRCIIYVYMCVYIYIYICPWGISRARTLIFVCDAFARIRRLRIRPVRLLRVWNSEGLTQADS